MSNTLLGALLYGGSFAFAALILPILERSAQRSGFLDRPEGRKDHATPTPLVGGVAILFGVAVPATLGLVLAIFRDVVPFPLPDVLLPHLPGVARRAPDLLLLLCSAGLLHAVGYLDDRRSLGALFRLGIQVLCAAAISASGTRVTLHLPEVWMHHVATVLFIVTIINGANFLDNMNGLCAGVLWMTAAALLGLAIHGGQLFVAAILLCVLGALGGFLLWNFPKARVFLGDAGSTALGFLLAVIAITLTYDRGLSPAHAGIFPGLAFLVVLADTTTVVLSRLSRGVHPFTAGHDHLSHRLVARGFRRTIAAGILIAVQGCAATALLLLAQVEGDVI
ncbi:MAG TPA: MraY family glycosyltransferase, partial [Planctomycetota bacterium]|nr:MraY family glycosyltransferase [Planctomycetota bacterium]